MKEIVIKKQVLDDDACNWLVPLTEKGALRRRAALRECQDFGLMDQVPFWYLSSWTSQTFAFLS